MSAENPTDLNPGLPLPPWRRHSRTRGGDSVPPAQEARRPTMSLDSADLARDPALAADLRRLTSRL